MQPDNPPAFPCPQRETQDGWSGPSDGQSLRDYFAARCFPVAYQHVGANKQGWNGVAQVAYQMADALLKARQS